VSLKATVCDVPINADCLTVLPSLPEKSIDLVLTDLPYGVTACKWDSVIPLDKLWHEYKRVAKDTTAARERRQNRMRKHPPEQFRRHPPTYLSICAPSGAKGD
jgi:hypothetical protein